MNAFPEPNGKGRLPNVRVKGTKGKTRGRGVGGKKQVTGTLGKARHRNVTGGNRTINKGNKYI